MTEQNKRIIELLEKTGTVDKATLQEKLKRLYYEEGNSPITDQEYDELFGDKDYVGYTVDQSGPWQVLPHKIPMGSLPKLKTWEDAQNWLKDKGQVIWQPKLDGLSIELVYEFGKLTHAILRGGGTEGEDILKNAKNFQYVPDEIPTTNKSYVSVRGEVVISNESFGKLLINSQESYSNRRNCVPGICRRYDGKYSEYLSFWAYDIIAEGVTYQEETSKLVALNHLGFKIPFSKIDMTEIEYQGYGNIRDTAEEFQMDGLVIKTNDLNFQIALKFEPNGEQTVVTNYTWEVGTTGKLVPIIWFEPVNVGGTTLKKASGASLRNVKQLNAPVGSIVEVRKMNDVIPKVTKCVKSSDKPLDIPTHCPICGSLLEEQGADLYCVNPNCLVKQENKCTSVYWAVAIKGIKDGWIKQLMVNGIITEPKDVLKVTPEQLSSTGMSLQRAQKVIEELRTKWKDIIVKNEVLPVLWMLPIPSIAGKAQEKLAGYFETIEGLYSYLVALIDDEPASKSDLTDLLGNSKGNAAYAYFVENRDITLNLINELRNLLQ